jgi:hypothetical protein
MRRANQILIRNLRSLPIRARKGRNALVSIFWSGFPRKSALRRFAACVRNRGAQIPRTTLVIVIGLKRTERRNPLSTPPRKVDKK